MVNLKLIAIAFCCIFSLTAHAGPGHSHHSAELISSQDASALASKRLNEHVELGIIDASWKNVPVSNVTQNDDGYGAEWTVWFELPAENDVQRLKMVFGEHGEYRAMNIQR